MNIVGLKCRVSRDPEDRQFDSGGGVITIGCGFLANAYKGNDGKMVYKNGWIDAKKFYGAQTSEGMINFLMGLVKGTNVLVSGHLDMDEWEDRNTGSKRTKLFLVIDKIDPIRASDTEGGRQPAAGGRGRGGATNTRRAPAQRRSAPPPDDTPPDDGSGGYGDEEAGAGPDGDGEEIPF